MQDRDEYINRIVIERIGIRRRMRLYRGIAVVFLILSLLPIFIVRYQLLMPVTPAVSSYLLNTSPLKFSRQHLALLLKTTGADERLLDALIWLFWSPGIFFAVAFITFGVSRLSRRKQAPWKRQFLELFNLKTTLLSYQATPSRWNRISIVRALLGATVFKRVVPVQRRWFATPETQWFTTSHLTKEIRPVVFAIHQFPLALLYATRNVAPLRLFIAPLDQLMNFYFSIACRRDPLIKDADHLGTELDMLKLFAQIARPVIIANNPYHTMAKAHTKSFSSRVYELLCQPLVKSGGTVATIAAVVMIVGVIVFKIEPAQAFLTWFVVAFGTFTLSVGITSFRMSRSESTDRNNINAGPAKNRS